MAIYFDSRYTSDMRLAVKEELLAVAEQTANSAKAAERERCAKIVESLRNNCVFDEEVAYELTALAAKIRSGE